MRYDEIYRMDEIKSLSFHIIFYRLYRGVAKYIVSGNSVFIICDLYTPPTTGREGETKAGGDENDQLGQNQELVPKRGTTSVAWSRIFLSTAVLKQPILSRWKSNNRAKYF